MNRQTYHWKFKDSRNSNVRRKERIILWFRYAVIRFIDFQELIVLEEIILTVQMYLID